MGVGSAPVGSSDGPAGSGGADRRPEASWPNPLPLIDPEAGSGLDEGAAPRVRVGVVSWNTAGLLDECLAAVPAALAGVDAEVVVVDNCSTDGSADVADRHGVRVIRNVDNVGYAKAMNQALAGPADILVALNPDTVPHPGSLSALVRMLWDGDPDVALISPKLLNPDGSAQHSVYRFPAPSVYLVAWFVPRFLQRGRLARRFWLEGRGPHDRSQDVDWVIGAVHVIRAAALADRAPYDERWFMYVEDLELCWWLAQRGWRRRLETGSEVVHVGNAAGAQMWRGQRARRYLEASYEWYGRDRGTAAARRWALVNLLGTTWWAIGHFAWNALTFNRTKMRATRSAAALVSVHWAALGLRRGGPTMPPPD